MSDEEHHTPLQEVRPIDDNVVVEIGADGTIINGHILMKGTVIALPVHELELYRDRGLILADVPDYDTREVFDHNARKNS